MMNWGMMIMNRDSQRLEKIKADRLELLKRVRESINKNGNGLSESIIDINEIIALDSINMKKIDSLEKAQELVASLVEQVIDAQSDEDVIKLRNKLNYLINKVKEEIKRRNVDEEDLIFYNNKLSYLRKDIAKYVRYLKRESIIAEIEDKLKNYNELTTEDKKRLKKLLRNERKYTTRNMKNDSHNKSERKSKSVVENKKKYDDEVEEYLDNKVNSFNQIYGIRETYEYSDSKFDNIKTFFKNIPIYIKNKRKIKYMNVDMNVFYNGSDLVGYAEYTKRRNSIKTGLKFLFNKSYLYSEEGKYLNLHDKCYKWLYNFYTEREMYCPLMLKSNQML